VDLPSLDESYQAIIFVGTNQNPSNNGLGQVWGGSVQVWKSGRESACVDLPDLTSPEVTWAE
jgi:hypothetical protein